MHLQSGENAWFKVADIQIVILHSSQLGLSCVTDNFSLIIYLFTTCLWSAGFPHERRRWRYATLIGQMLLYRYFARISYLWQEFPFGFYVIYWLFWVFRFLREPDCFWFHWIFFVVQEFPCLLVSVNLLHEKLTCFFSLPFLFITQQTAVQKVVFHLTRHQILPILPHTNSAVTLHRQWTTVVVVVCTMRPARSPTHLAPRLRPNWPVRSIWRNRYVPLLGRSPWIARTNVIRPDLLPLAMVALYRNLIPF